MSYPAASKEGRLQRPHSWLAGERQRLVGELGVLRARRHEDARPDPVVAAGRFEDELVQRERHAHVRHAVVRDDQGPLGALGVEVRQQGVDRRAR